jgi:hypothetical protein
MQPFTYFRRFAAISALSLVLSASSASGIVLLTNLIQNPGAEDGPGDASYNVEPVAIPGWVTTNNFTAVQYAAGGPFDLNASSPGPTDRGVNFFAGGRGFEESTATQVISFTQNLNLIDEGGLQFQFSAWLGGYDWQNDRMQVSATFRDAAEDTLGSVVTLGPVTNEERNDVSSLLFRETSGTLPSGTRSVVIEMRAIRAEGTYNDGYADNLNFTVIPEPSMLAVPVTALLLVMLRRRALRS